MAERPDNVIDLAPHRMARLVGSKPSRPYLMWYPTVGFVLWPSAAAVPTALRSQQATRVGKHT